MAFYSYYLAIILVTIDFFSTFHKNSQYLTMQWHVLIWASSEQIYFFVIGDFVNTTGNYFGDFQ